MAYHHIHGHEPQIAFLKQVVLTGKTAQAYLFSGPEGVGKKTVALSFAASLLCPSPGRRGEGCGLCSTCERIKKGIHPDAIIISPAGANIKVQDIREMIAATAIHPLEGSRRVVIIDEADRMSEPAANTMLKTLEEPREGNFFILVTARPHQLPITIISRTQILHFSPLPQDEITEFMIKNTRTPKEKAKIIASCASGSISQALHLTRADYLSFREKMAGNLKKALLSGAMAPLLLSRFLSQEKVDLEEKLSLLATLFRDALWLKETGSAEGIVNVDLLEIIEILADKLAPRQMARNIRTLTQALLDLEQNANKSLTLDASLFSLSYP